MNKHRQLKIIIAFSLSATFVTDSVHAQMINPLAMPIPMDPDLTSGTLSNGMRYYVLPNKTPTKKVELRLVVKAGSLNETDTEQGIAHFLEHMAFQGTTHFPKKQLTGELEKMGVRFGADLNAYTGFSETVYKIPVSTVAPKNLSTAMQVLEDWAFNLTITKDAVEAERGVVKEEWRIRTQNPEQAVLDKNLPIFARGSAYPNRQPIGKTEVIEHASPELLRGFYDKWYRPDNMAVVMVGDVDAISAVKMIEQYFGAHNNPKTLLMRPIHVIEDHESRVKSVLYNKDLSQNVVTWLHVKNGAAPAERSLGDYEMKFKRILIDQMMNRRLAALVDTAAPPFVGASAGSAPLGGIVREKFGRHIVAFSLPNQQLKALGVLRDEVARIIQFGFTQTELSREVSVLLANTQQLYNNRSSVASEEKANEYIRGETEGEALPSIGWENDTMHSMLSKLKLEDINALAKNELTGKNQIVLVSGNDTKNALTSTSIDAVLDKAVTVKPYVETKNTTSLQLKTPVAGRIIATKINPVLHSTTWTLSNGVKVSYKVTDFDDDSIVFSSSQAGGFSKISNDDWQKSQWAFSGLTEGGVNGLSQTELANVLSGKLVDVNLDANETAVRLKGSFAPKDIETELAYANSLMTGLNHNPQKFSGYVKRGIAENANLENDRMTVFNDIVARDIWHNNPRFSGTYPTTAAWQNTDYDTAYRIYKSQFKNANGRHFAFVGKINPTELKRWSEVYLGSLPSDLSTKPRFVDLKYRPDYRERVITVKKGHEPLSVVKIMFGGEAAFESTDTLTMEALGAILTTRLRNQLRETQNGVYSVEAAGRLIKTPYKHFNFTIAFPCEPNKVDSLTASATATLKNLINEGVSAEELDKFKQARRITNRERLKKNGFWLTQLMKKQSNDDGEDNISNESKHLESLNSLQIQTLAAKYLNGEKVVAILKPE